MKALYVKLDISSMEIDQFFEDNVGCDFGDLTIE